jgi:hypothetical protein
MSRGRKAAINLVVRVSPRCFTNRLPIRTMSPFAGIRLLGSMLACTEVAATASANRAKPPDAVALLTVQVQRGRCKMEGPQAMAAQANDVEREHAS